jgi:hypothetical protein
MSDLSAFRAGLESRDTRGALTHKIDWANLAIWAQGALKREAKSMSRLRTAVGLIIAVGGGAAVVALVGFLLSRPGPNSTPLHAVVKGTIKTTHGTLPHAFLNLDTWPDSMAGEHGSDGGAHPDWVSYGPSTNLFVPAHSYVTVTIHQYDTGGQITNPFFSHVHGTVGGTEVIDGKTARGANPDSIGHTFTLRAAPTNQTTLFVSVPLPAVSDNAQPVKGSAYPKPHVVQFSFITGSKGTYVWNCEYPCGDGYYAFFGGPMGTRGYMSGTLTVG